MHDFESIREHYKSHGQKILSVSASRYGLDPYAWSNLIQMTPIEDALWCDFRSLGIVMYPQYPVGRYFVDFGNPKAKVAIECDGAAYHQDKAADKKRHQEIEALGWTVYRFTGRECKEANEEVFGDEETTYGRLRAIASVHGLSSSVLRSDELENYYANHELPRVAAWF